MKEMQSFRKSTSFTDGRQISFGLTQRRKSVEEKKMDRDRHGACIGIRTFGMHKQ